MFAKRVTVVAFVGLALLLGSAQQDLNGQDKQAGDKKVWTDVNDPARISRALHQVSLEPRRADREHPS